MKIIVLVKVVPDTYSPRRLDLGTGLADRGASEAVLDEIGERAIEVAISVAEAHRGSEIVLVSVGPSAVSVILRKGLAMGGTRAVHVLDDRLIGADVGLTGVVLTAAVRRVGFDLVIAGNLSTDGAGGVVPAILAERLDVPGLMNLSSVQVDDGVVAGVRATESGSFEVRAELPAVISITERAAEPRFPTFKGILAAKKKPLETLSLTDLDVDPADESMARSIVTTVASRPPRGDGVTIVDDGGAADRLVEFLVENRLV